MTLLRSVTSRREIVICTLVLGSTLLLAGPGFTESEWKPERAVEVVVGVAPGGAQDRTARDIERFLRDGRFIPANSIVVNKPGGGHAVALSYTIAHAGDPHYLQNIGGVMLSNNILGRSPLKYTDVTPIATLFDEQMAFAVRSDSKIKDAKTLLDMLKKDPGSVSFSISSGIGTTNHISALLVADAVGADLTKLKTVSFDSAAEGVTATLGGHIDVVITTPFALNPFVEGGQLRYIAVASAARTPGPLADVPTWKELGVDAVVSAWRLVVAPPNLKPEQVAYWDKAFAAITATPKWAELVAKESFVPHYLDSAQTKAFLASEDARYRKVLSVVTGK
jgi:putative tricarboxylic transport membrane protein